MKNFWLSWIETGAFSLSSPWWVSGEIADGKGTKIVAAVYARSGDEARAVVTRCRDTKTAPEFRFVEERPADWIPFSDRFPRADWMLWPFPGRLRRETWAAQKARLFAFEELTEADAKLDKLISIGEQTNQALLALVQALQPKKPGRPKKEQVDGD